mgnify:CR=1 FL=1
MIIDRDLSLSSQVSKVCWTCIGLLHSLKKLVPFLSRPALRMVASAVTLSHLDYRNSLYLGLSASSLARLQVVQNDAARLILNMLRWAHASPALRALHWLPVAQRVKFKSLCFAFKSLKQSAPEFIRERLVPYVPTRSLRSPSASLLSVPRFRNVRTGGRRFAVLVPGL